jgi:hypothetical protein
MHARGSGELVRVVVPPSIDRCRLSATALRTLRGWRPVSLRPVRAAAGESHRRTNTDRFPLRFDRSPRAEQQSYNFCTRYSVVADTSTLTIVWRVGVVVFVVLAPTFMYLQLLRLLEWMRDDDLIARVVEQHDLETTDTDGHLAAMATDSRQLYFSGGADDSDDTDDGLLVRCPSCGQRNPTGVTYCAGCLGRLE